MSKSILSVIVFSMLTVLVIIPLVFAAGEKSEVATAAAQVLVCKAEFTAKVVTGTIAAVPNASSLTTYSDKLNADIVQLKTLANAGDAKELRTFLKTYEADVKSAREAVQQWRKEHRTELTQEQRRALQTGYGDLKKTLDNCHLAALKVTGTKRVAEFAAHLDKYDAMTAKLTARGIDTSGLTQIVADARTQIVTPLQQAVQAATTELELKAALKKYCLYDGCKEGINYHLAAKYDLEKATALLAYAKAQQNVSAEKIAQAQTALDTARAALTRVGTGQYTDEGKEIFSGIKNANQAFKEAHFEVKNVERKAVHSPGTKEGVGKDYYYEGGNS